MGIALTGLVPTPTTSRGDVSRLGATHEGNPVTLHEAIREAQSWLRNHPESGPYLVRVDRLVRGKWQPTQNYLVKLHALNPNPPQIVVDGGWRYVPVESFNR